MTRAIGVLAGGLFVLPMTGCSDATVDGESLPSVTAELPSDAPSTEDVGEAVESAVEADCAGMSCELTLATGQEAEVLGTTLSFTGSEDGTATLQADGRSVTCTEGEEISAGPVSVECSAISDDSVTLAASLG